MVLLALGIEIFQDLFANRQFNLLDLLAGIAGVLVFYMYNCIHPFFNEN
jgi:hypothetical protein